MECRGGGKVDTAVIGKSNTVSNKHKKGVREIAEGEMVNGTGKGCISFGSALQLFGVV